MKSTRPFPKAKITKKGERFIKQPHPWVYKAEITEMDGGVENGALVDVFSEKDSYLGTGLYSEKSKIAVRLLSSNANDRYDEAFFRRRLAYALDYRYTAMAGDVSSCRLVFGEADGLPGLTVDKYSDILVTQVLSFGMDLRRDMIYGLLVELLSERGEHIAGIFERNDVSIRSLEGLPIRKGWYEGLPHGERTATEIVENGIRYNVDFESGQKTGFFLDQKFNRREIQRIAKGRTVLDCFTHTGSFALNAAKGGAKRVTAIDISDSALDMARRNAALNGIDGIEFCARDVFDLLPELCEKPPEYDMVILDPPAFTKSRSTVGSAERGYKEINYRAMKLLPRGGYLATCSCSHFMRNDLFVNMLVSAARDASRELKQLEARQQSPDHPILWNVPETDYLKFYIFQVI